MTYPIYSKQDFYPSSGASPAQRGTGVVETIKNVSARTGVSFSYLVNNAMAESSLDPTAKAKTSSASGLYQFTQKTWLQMVRDHGADMGLERYAACVDDECRVANPSVRQNILALRQDPEISAMMAAKYAEMNASQLEKSVGAQRAIGDTELYLAHVFGASGATKFLNELTENPNQVASRVFPTEARVNKGLFYQNGNAQTLQDIYDRFAAKFQGTSSEEAEQYAGTQPEEIMMQVNSMDRTADFGAMMSDKTAYDWDQQDVVQASGRRARVPAHQVMQDFSDLSRGRGGDVSALDSLNQPALLVMAQNYRHNQQSRYNG